MRPEKEDDERTAPPLRRPTLLSPSFLGNPDVPALRVAGMATAPCPVGLVLTQKATRKRSMNKDGGRGGAGGGGARKRVEKVRFLLAPSLSLSPPPPHPTALLLTRVDANFD